MAQTMYFSKDHEWISIEGNRAKIGITDYAQQTLGSIVYVELPPIGKMVAAGGVLGVVESVKSASDVFTPVSGTVVEINQALVDQPELLNESPYESYIAILDITNAEELNGLMDEAQYLEYVNASH